MDWKTRLRDMLEPILSKDDLVLISALTERCHSASFYYEPSCEFALRQELSLLKTRLEQRGKRILKVSLIGVLDGSVSTCRYHTC